MWRASASSYVTSGCGRCRRAPPRYGSEASIPTAFAPCSARASVSTPVPHPTSRDAVAPLDAGKLQERARQAAAPSPHEVFVDIRIGRLELGHREAHHKTSIARVGEDS